MFFTSRKATRTLLRAGSGRNRQAIILLFLVSSSTERMHLKVREIYGKQLIFWEMEIGILSHCCCYFCCSAPSLVFFVLCVELGLIAFVVPLPPFRSSSYLCHLELEKWSVMNLLCEPCSFSRDNQSFFGREGLNLENNEMGRALPVLGRLSCVRQAINHLF